ncbi:glycoside hydrolase family 53 protein [Flaviaesturariibacter amylovorans]|uniref:Arabinogalactan endo-beta-1,4-galactanase n=1 Tax=Flaviaesturariibacter amylovorans TaxID=1084520 RepID=A0ABP8H7Z0_9BACT
MRTLLLLCLAAIGFASCKKERQPAVPTPLPPVPVDTTTVAVTDSFAKGADVSWITEMEAAGRRFYNSAGAEMEGMALLKSLGMNTIRLRVWVNPAGGWNGKNDVLAKALRAKALGMRVMVDFHYSDSWADPGQQTKPAAWAALNLQGLKGALAAHTVDILSALRTAGVTPEWVQVGNETNNGMLWPEGRASSNMAAYAALVDTGYVAVKSVFPAAKVIVHVSNGWDNGLFTWNIGGLVSNGARFDVIGLSVYPTLSNWATTNGEVAMNMNNMAARYNKHVMVVEVGMPWDSPQECGPFIADLIRKTRAVPNRKGLGVLYWEPQAYGGWKGYTLGAFDNSGKPTPALAAFQ